ncbi:ComEC/Rec2 family competence protein [Luethyella okanaganae]|uniref:ComEC/Rec2 family competence protein n=1 Tax=Luethyella okanaganae TaxID=69372 RepID=A0ABW1VGL5_9MICO
MNAESRLALPAGAAWLAGIGVVTATDAAWGIAAGLWAVAGLAIAASLLFGQRGWRSALPMLALCCTAAALVSSVVAVTAPARQPSALVAAADAHREVTMTATVLTVPRESRSGGAFGEMSSRVRFTARIEEIGFGTSGARDIVPVHGGIPVLVFAESPSTLPEPTGDPSNREGALEIGTVIRASGSLVETDPGEQNAFLVFAREPPLIETAPPGLLAWASAIRAGLSRAASALPGDGGDLLPGLAIGDTRAVSAALDADMKTSSLSHLTAVSGANCAIVIAGIMALGGLAGLARWLRIALALLVLGGFVVLVTPEPSVLRAATMAAIVLLATVSGRRSRGVPALALAVMTLVVFDPWISRSYGFALSVLATAGLLVLSGPLTGMLARWMPLGLAAVIAIPLSAQLACQPVLVLLSPNLSLYGVPANLLAAPAALLGTVIGLIACLLLPVLPSVGFACAQLAWLPSAWIAAVGHAVARLPGTRLPWLDGIAGAVLLAIATAIALRLVVRRTRSGRALVTDTAAAAVLIALLGGYAGTLVGVGVGRTLARPPDWQIAVCDIGQGDAVLVRNEESVALVDAGPSPAPLTACLDALGIDRIDLLVLTHYDLDHVGGADAVVGRVDVALVGEPENSADERLTDRLAAGGARVVQTARGDHGTLGSQRWEVLWPLRTASTMRFGNDGSVTICFEGNGIRSIFLGDLGEESQQAMLAAVHPEAADVVKVAHHGSANQSAALYDRLGATVGLISVGVDNGYGHPTRALLDILDAAGTSAFRTDLDGMILVAHDPGFDGGLIVWSERGG